MKVDGSVVSDVGRGVFYEVDSSVVDEVGEGFEL